MIAAIKRFVKDWLSREAFMDYLAGMGTINLFGANSSDVLVHHVPHFMRSHTFVLNQAQLDCLRQIADAGPKAWVEVKVDAGAWTHATLHRNSNHSNPLPVEIVRLLTMLGLLSVVNVRKNSYLLQLNIHGREVLESQ